MEIIIDYFSQPQNGILGILVIMLIGVVLWQQRRMDKKDTLINDLLEKRVSDANTFRDGYVDTTREIVGIQKDNLNAINLLQRSIDAIAQTLQNIVKK